VWKSHNIKVDYYLFLYLITNKRRVHHSSFQIAVLILSYATRLFLKQKRKMTFKFPKGFEVIIRAIWATFRLSYEDIREMRSISLPEDITEIGTEAFAGFENLTEITIPYSVQRIRWAAFYNCKNLRKVTLLNPFTTFDGNPFEKCGSLETIDFGEITEPENIELPAELHQYEWTGYTSHTINEGEENEFSYIVQYTHAASTTIDKYGTFEWNGRVEQPDTYEITEFEQSPSIELQDFAGNQWFVDGVCDNPDSLFQELAAAQNPNIPSEGWEVMLPGTDTPQDLYLNNLDTIMDDYPDVLSETWTFVWNQPESNEESEEESEEE